MPVAGCRRSPPARSRGLTAPSRPPAPPSRAATSPATLALALPGDLGCSASTRKARRGRGVPRRGRLSGKQWLFASTVRSQERPQSHTCVMITKNVSRYAHVAGTQTAVREAPQAPDPAEHPHPRPLLATAQSPHLPCLRSLRPLPRVQPKLSASGFRAPPSAQALRTAPSASPRGQSGWLPSDL